jgi:hypothetical protein
MTPEFNSHDHTLPRWPSAPHAQRPPSRRLGPNAAGLIDGRASPIDKAKPIPLLTGGWNFDQDEFLFARSGGQAIVERHDLQ